MLRAPAEFPHPGAPAFLRESASPVRIVRHNPNETTFVSLQPTNADPLIGRLASGSRTVPTADLCKTLDEALGLAPRRRKAAVKRRPRKAAAKRKPARKGRAA